MLCWKTFWIHAQDLLDIVFYLASSGVQKLIWGLASISHHHHSSLDWQPPNFDWSNTTELSLLLPRGLHDMDSLAASPALGRRENTSSEGLLAPQWTLTQTGNPAWRWSPAVGWSPLRPPGTSCLLSVERCHGCCPSIENWNMIVNWGSGGVALHHLEVLQPAVQLASFDGTLGPPTCAWGARNTGQVLPLCYRALPAGLISWLPPVRRSS